VEALSSDVDASCASAGAVIATAAAKPVERKAPRFIAGKVQREQRSGQDLMPIAFDEDAANLPPYATL